MTLNFDVLIASTGRIHLLEKGLDSIFLKRPKELNYVRVLTQREDLETIAFVEEQSKHRSIKLIIVDKMPNPGATRNILIQQSESTYLHFLDDDAMVSSNYYKNAILRLQKTNCLILGGPDRSPLDGNTFQKTFEYILTQKFVMSDTLMRHSTESNIVKIASEYDLTLCNLWIKRSVFEEYSLKFNELFKRCEENEFLKSAAQRKIQFIYDSNLYVYHYRRERWIDLLRIHYVSGIYRGIISVEDLLQFRTIFIIPFITGLILVWSIFFSWKLLVLGLVIHAIPTGIIGVKSTIKTQDLKSFIYTFKIVWCIHIGFSLGMVWGFCKGLFQNEK